jgi:H+-transporting ATPase
LERGLTSEEARKRIDEYGHNEVPEKRVSRTIRFIKNFWGLTPWMLEITIGLEWVLGKYSEMYVVMGLLVFNAVLGFSQEERANSALQLLKEKLKINARVKRNGNWTVIPAREIVPGDVIRLRAGDFIPARFSTAGPFLEEGRLPEWWPQRVQKLTSAGPWNSFRWRNPSCTWKK